VKGVECPQVRNLLLEFGKESDVRRVIRSHSFVENSIQLSMNLRNKFCVSKSRSICTNTNTHVELVSHEVSLWHEDEDVMKRKLCEEEIRRDRQTEQE
jgi:hypothetical protein